ncbi:uncharacterized protein B0I36DRAFT_314473 [Microdochium trichocladiopsis]|uniref:tRNA (uracil-O(2)-)-methyltransferase n=1 Tax=Microdochium trichocladiopsis TaxID=1682393 RepID=A0A9P8YGM6_9PEZI|nr:uncharacterized protein B0I36DRAFT_314473 [Microdochium trichocladiopsis]KAH7037629.1 hypothetical protein B0I36DRAFT_314473 [Microdochium trichocladiopsis]
MVAFNPTELPPGSPSSLEDVSGEAWVPLYEHDCPFDDKVFFQVMRNLIRNPNLNSSWLFRADILLEASGPEGAKEHDGSEHLRPRTVHFQDYAIENTLIRKLIPRNTKRDQPMDQTCLSYRRLSSSEEIKSLVVYKPHIDNPADMPFYHPRVKALAFHHEWNSSTETGRISIHYNFFDDYEGDAKLGRTAYHLLSTLHKHGLGTLAGYVKRVQHDTIVPQTTVQNTYARLKEKYARALIDSWAEVTDPDKHVFEDLSIAAFLIKLWAQIYGTSPFPGFVDIGCGNGLLVYILRQEGYAGWGFDARMRKSWDNYQDRAKETEIIAGQPVLQQRVLLPCIIGDGGEPTAENSGPEQESDLPMQQGTDGILHDGRFPEGTFIISNHADELTPWTPILAAISNCPFLMIPCCSHALSGAKFRAPPPKGQGKSPSAYSSLVDWVTSIGTECGWVIEKEMLRIPSTRNTGLIGRTRTSPAKEIDLNGLVARYGGTAGYLENVMQLATTAPRGH